MDRSLGADNMRYYKIVENGYISSIGTGGGGTEITETEYNEILSAIRNKPPRDGSIDYRLKADLTWEQYEREPEIHDDTPEGLNEVTQYLLENQMMRMPPEPEEPDYFNENEQEPNYFEEA